MNSVGFASPHRYPQRCHEAQTPDESLGELMLRQAPVFCKTDLRWQTPIYVPSPVLGEAASLVPARVGHTLCDKSRVLSDRFRQPQAWDPSRAFEKWIAKRISSC